MKRLFYFTIFCCPQILDKVSKSLIESQSLINIKYSLNSEFSLHARITVNVSESGSGSWKTVFKFKPG